MASSRAVVGALLVLSSIWTASLSAQNPTDLSGSWTLNRQLSQFPSELGFSASFLDTSRTGADDGGRRGPVAPRVQSQSAEDAQRVRFLTDEVRVPYERLTLSVTPATVTITPDRAPARSFQPGKRDEAVTLGPVTASATASWELDRLVIIYKAETGRTLRYTYSLNASPRQLIVDVEFIERGGGDKVRRIYEPATAAPGTGGANVPAPVAVPASSAQAPAAPASSGQAPSTPAGTALDQRPDSPLKGLTRLGVVLEGFSADAAKCGLTQEAIDSAVAKRLTDAGLRVIRNSDDDTYLYVNINTVTATAALCVSRYDVTLYSHVEGRLSYTASPVPLQAELLHRGGLTGGGPAAHAAGVMKGLLEYVDQFTTRIRNANN
jgi:hypothetical protein